MLPWIFVVLLALNLTLFLWGYRNEHLREPPLPPVPAGQFEIRLLSEIEAEPPAVAGEDGPPPEAGAPPDLPSASDEPAPAAPDLSAEDHAPPPDLIEPDGTGDDAWVERELVRDAEAAGDRAREPPTAPGASPEPDPDPDPDPELETLPLPDDAGNPERETATDVPPPIDALPEPPIQPTPDELREPPPSGLRPLPETPIRQPRIPGGVSAIIESTV